VTGKPNIKGIVALTQMLHQFHFQSTC